MTDERVIVMQLELHASGIWSEGDGWKWNKRTEKMLDELNSLIEKYNISAITTDVLQSEEE